MHERHQLFEERLPGSWKQLSADYPDGEGCRQCTRLDHEYRRVSSCGDTDEANNTGSDPTTITVGPDLTLTKTHTGNFTKGQTGATYTVTVTNQGVGPTTCTVTVTDNVPAGLTPTAASGAGWTCTIVSDSILCQRSDALAGGASYPPITLTLNVSSSRGLGNQYCPTLRLRGHQCRQQYGNRPDQRVAGPDLAVSNRYTGNFAQKQTGATYTLTVQNNGGAPTSGTVTLIDRDPAGHVVGRSTGTG